MECGSLTCKYNKFIYIIYIYKYNINISIIYNIVNRWNARSARCPPQQTSWQFAAPLLWLPCISTIALIHIVQHREVKALKIAGVPLSQATSYWKLVKPWLGYSSSVRWIFLEKNIHEDIERGNVYDVYLVVLESTEVHLTTINHNWQPQMSSPLLPCFSQSSALSAPRPEISSCEASKCHSAPPAPCVPFFGCKHFFWVTRLPWN